MEIHEFFSNLNDNIARSKTTRALRILGKQARRFTNSILNSNVAQGTKNVVKSSYKNSVHFISEQAKRLT